MLDRIQNNGLDLIGQNQNLDKVSSVGMSNPIEDDKDDYKKYFIDESRISSLAFEKYQREIDIKEFSEILKQTDENEANTLVIKNIFDGKYSIENDDFLSGLINNKDFLNDIFS